MSTFSARAVDSLPRPRASDVLGTGWISPRMGRPVPPSTTRIEVMDDDDRGLHERTQRLVSFEDVEAIVRRTRRELEDDDELRERMKQVLEVGWSDEAPTNED